jgi:hypothetical protein
LSIRQGQIKGKHVLNRCAGYIQFAFRDRANNEFVSLGGAGWLTEAELQQAWNVLPEFPGNSDFIAVLLDEMVDITASKPVSFETVEVCLHKPIGALIEQGRKALQAKDRV